MSKCFADVLDVNLVHIHETSVGCHATRFLNYFVTNRVSILLYQDHTTIYSFLSRKPNAYHNMIPGYELTELLKTNVEYTKSELKKMKLEDIQNICKMKNMPIKKQGKGIAFIARKREELISDLTGEEMSVEATKDSNEKEDE